MTALAHEPLHRPHFSLPSRTWRVVGAVLLAHLGLAWLLSLGLLSSAPPAGEPDNVIMATVVMDVPAPPAPTPQPVVPKPQPQAKPSTKPTTPVTPQVQPIPLVTQAAPA